MERGYHPPLLRMVRPLWYVSPRLGPQGKRDIEKWEKVQRRLLISPDARRT